MERYLDPKNDLTFKRVFGEHPAILISLLNALLPLAPHQQIVQITYLPAELTPELTTLKNTIVDVRCIDHDGRQFVVEMQMLWAESYRSRVLYNACKVFDRQLQRGDDFLKLQPVYMLTLLNNEMLPATTEWYHHYTVRHTTIVNEKLAGIEFVFVELPKFKARTFGERRIQILWLRFLSTIENNTTMVPQELMDIPEIAEAVALLKESAYTPEELQQYERFWDAVRLQKSIMRELEEKGKLEGIIEGRVEGIQQGKMENKLEVAKKMLSNNFSIAHVVEITGLSEEEVQQLIA